MDVSGNLFIADQGHSRIRRVDATSRIISTVAGGGSGFTKFTDDHGRYCCPNWSPDGSKIAFGREGGISTSMPFQPERQVVMRFTILTSVQEE